MPRDRDDERRPSKRGFTYQENDAGAARKASSGSGDFDGPFLGQYKVFKPGEGKHKIRVLPRTWGDDDGPPHWGYEIWVHYGIGADESAYLCLNKMKGEKCPICEERTQVARSGDEEQAKELRPSKAIAVWIIDRNNEGEGPQLWRMPVKKVHFEICERSDNSETGEMLKVDHPDKGYDVRFRREGTKRNTDYVAIEIDRDPSPLADDDRDAEEWLDFVLKNPIPACLNFQEADYIEKVLGGTVSKKDKASEEEDEGRSRRRSRDDGGEARPAGRRRREPEPEAEPERPARRSRPADDDDEPARPARRSTRLADIDEPKDDDGPLERPAKRRASEEDDEPRPARRGRRDEEAEDTRASKRRNEDADDEDDTKEPEDDEVDEPKAKAATGRRELRDQVTQGLGRRRRE